jgi:hypothetical protein
MIKEVMEITRVQELFALFDTTEEAEQALRGGR